MSGEYTNSERRMRVGLTIAGAVLTLTATVAGATLFLVDRIETKVTAAATAADAAYARRDEVIRLHDDVRGVRGDIHALTAKVERALALADARSTGR